MIACGKTPMGLRSILALCRRALSARRRPQLHMLWPESPLRSPPPFTPPDGLQLRTYRRGDEPALVYLMGRAGFAGWGAARVTECMGRALPDGYFVVAETDTNRIVAATLAAHNPSPLHPSGGELCWVAADPDYRRRGLGYAVCAAATCRLLRAGYRRIYLKTDDFRLPAINLYLRLGYVPFLFEESMAARWEKICDRLERSCTPEAWPAVGKGDGAASARAPAGRSDSAPLRS